ncbi:MAG TPA: hypothetical protein VFG20_21250 [Planctomycetaceae bacterium]|jgi:hypothetical protein|nr:hypothetical protein [Planctomycetaceae bacterium]
MTHPHQLDGVVSGRSITLDQDPGVPDGTRITVVIQPQKATTAMARMEDLPGFGALSGKAEELDEFDAWCREQRRAERTSQGCEP